MDIDIPFDLYRSAEIAGGALLVGGATLATGLRGALRTPLGKAAAAGAAATLLGTHAVWAYGVYIGSWSISHEASIWAIVTLIPIAMVAGSLPLAALVWRARGRPSRDAGAPPTEAEARGPAGRPLASSRRGASHLGRRQIVKAAAAAAPITAAATSARGFYNGLELPAVRPLSMEYADLPPALDGLLMNWTGAQAGEGFEYHLLALGLAAIVLVRGGGAGSLDARLARALGRTRDHS